MSGQRKSSPRKNSAKSTRRSVWSGELTKEQLDLLYWNTWAFHQAAMAVRKEKDDKRLPLGSYQEISATTAALMNLGLSLELILKYCIAVTGNKFPQTHVLPVIHAEMPEKLRLKMDTAYDEYLRNNAKPDVFQATLRSPSEPPDPPMFDLRTLESLLSYLDAIGTYDKRYQFEQFTQDQWWIRVDVDWLAGLVSAFVQVANTLRANPQTT